MKKGTKCKGKGEDKEHREERRKRGKKRKRWKQIIIRFDMLEGPNKILAIWSSLEVIDLSVVIGGRERGRWSSLRLQPQWSSRSRSSLISHEDQVPFAIEVVIEFDFAVKILVATRREKESDHFEVDGFYCFSFGFYIWDISLYVFIWRRLLGFGLS